MDNLKEMDTFLEIYNLPRFNFEEIENQRRPIMSKDIGSVIINLPQKKIPGFDGFTGKFYETFNTNPQKN